MNADAPGVYPPNDETKALRAGSSEEKGLWGDLSWRFSRCCWLGPCLLAFG